MPTKAKQKREKRKSRHEKDRKMERSQVSEMKTEKEKISEAVSSLVKNEKEGCAQRKKKETSAKNVSKSFKFKNNVPGYKISTEEKRKEFLNSKGQLKNGNKKMPRLNVAPVSDIEKENCTLKLNQKSLLKKERQEKYRKNVQNILAAKAKKYYENKRAEILHQRKLWHVQEKQHILKKKRLHYQKHMNEIIENRNRLHNRLSNLKYKKQYRLKKKVFLKAKDNEYYRKNTSEISQRRKNACKQKKDVFELQRRRWIEKNKATVLQRVKKWCLTNTTKYSILQKKYYIKNAAFRNVQKKLWLSKRKEEVQAVRKQRYSLYLLLQSRYYRQKSLGRLKQGEKAAEYEFSRKLFSKRMRKENSKKCQNFASVRQKCKSMIRRLLNFRRECVKKYTESLVLLRKHCMEVTEKITDVAEATTVDVFGNGEHEKFREPFFHDFSYHVLKENEWPISAKWIDECSEGESENEQNKKEKQPEKVWACTELCVFPQNAKQRLFEFFAKIENDKGLRKYIANIDECNFRIGVRKDCTVDNHLANSCDDKNICPDVTILKGHHIRCLPHNCSSVLLFFRQLAVHYRKMHLILRDIYEMKQYDLDLATVDALLHENNYSKIEIFLETLQTKASYIRGEAKSEKSSSSPPEEIIYEKPYAMDFSREIMQNPCFVCASCRIMHYRKGVREVLFEVDSESENIYVLTGQNKKKASAKKVCNELWMQLYAYMHLCNYEAGKDTIVDKAFLCSQCYAFLMQGKKHAPISAFMNKMHVDKTPKLLASTNDFEKLMIQKAKCFQVVYRLGTVSSKLPSRCKVKAHKGQVVYYPLPLEKTLETLPKMDEVAPPELYIIVYGVPTKNKKVWKSLVDVTKVKKAVELLKCINKEYQSVEVEVDFLNEAELSEENTVDTETLEKCQSLGDRAMLSKIDKKEEAMIIDCYTIQSVQTPKTKVEDLELYKLENIVADRIDPREKKLDLWCFPHLFPYGEGGEGEQRQGVSNAQFLRSRLYNEDPKFRHDQQYLFYLLKRHQMRNLAAGVMQCLRNTRMCNNLSVHDFVQKIESGDQEIESNLNTVFSQIRGSAQYWSRKRAELRTMVRAYGPPTWFVTLSAAEYDWEDMGDALRNINKDIAGIDKMETGEICAMDPVMTVRQFHHRFSAFFRNVLKRKGGGPLGEIEHYFWRIEYQSRGAPHYHMVLWAKDAPRIGVNEPEEVANYIQKHVTCRLPDQKKEPILNSLVQRYQWHNCNAYCRRKRKINGKFFTKCRFGFPRKVTDAPLLHDPLKTCNKRSKGYSESRLYELQRTARERCINDYNEDMLLLWEGNMDVQFIGENTTAVVNYIVSYLTKKEESCLEEMWNDIQSCDSLAKKLFKFGIRCLSSRECGAYEAADILCGQRLYGKSSQTRFINARKPHLRNRQLKTLKELKVLQDRDPNSTDKYEKTWIDSYYPDRADDLEPMCLYDFCRLFDKMKEPDGLYPFRTAENGSLCMRSKPYLISHPFYNKLQKEEEYCYCLLLMFKPFRSEADELIDEHGTCVSIFESELLVNEKMRELHDKLQEEHIRIEENRKAIEESLPQGVNENEKETENGDEANLLGDPLEVANAMQDVEAMMQINSEENAQENIAKMNCDQKRVFDRITEHLESAGDPLRMFVSGAGGTGKSFIINTLKLWAFEKYECCSSVVVAAPTGLAAFNVNGMTLHRLLHLPVQHKTTAAYYELADPTRKELFNTLRHVKLVVIDEVSMVSNLMLAYINLRLNEIFRTPDELFGGLNVLFFGDFAQLTPVSEGPIFKALTSKDVRKKLGALSGINLWEYAFTAYDELSINMRQKEDPQYAEILDRLRFGHTTEKDVTVLQSRLVKLEDNTDISATFADYYSTMRQTVGKDIVCLMPKTLMVSEFNDLLLQREGKAIFEIVAKDNIEMKKTSKLIADSAKKMLKKRENNISDTAGIETILRVCLGCRVMLRRNESVSEGLVNGAIGTVIGFRMEGDKIMGIEVKFDNIRDPTIMRRTKVKFDLNKNVSVTREQFPLVLAYAMTIHKSQGLSLLNVVVDAGKNIFQEGMMYVALSRVRTLSGLHLLNFDPTKAKANSACIKEINRLRRTYLSASEDKLILMHRMRLTEVKDRIWYKSNQTAKVMENEAALGKEAEKTADMKKVKGRRKRNSVESPGQVPKKALNIVKAQVAKAHKMKGDTCVAKDAVGKKPAAKKSVEKGKSRLKECATVRSAKQELRADSFVQDFVKSMMKDRIEKASTKEKIVPWPNFENRRGVSCYSNSVLQVLFRCEKFFDICTEAESTIIKEEIQEVALSYFSKLELNATLSTESLRSALAEAGYEFKDSDGQQCAFDFTQAMIAEADAQELFKIVAVKRRTCCNCSFDAVIDRNCQLPYISICPSANYRENNMLVLLEKGSCLVDFPCPQCCSRGCVFEFHDMDSFSDYTIILISRHSGGVADDFNNAPILNFDPNNLRINGCLMKVVGAIFHYGNTLNSGHYISIIRSGAHGWLKCNDDLVTMCDFPVDLRNAYMLILEKVDEASNSNVINITV